MPVHQVEQGDCFLSIADKYGFFWETLWEHPENAELSKKRKDPAILFPGDVVFVPEKRLKELNEPTNNVHEYRMKNVPVKLQLRFLDDDNTPRANVKYTLDVDGKEFSGTTSGSGEIKIAIPPGAQNGKLILDPEGNKEEFDLFLGYLDPIDKLIGVKARLKGLGYYQGETNNEENVETEEAVKEFQKATGLEISGIVDDPLRKKLQEIYGS